MSSYDREPLEGIIRQSNRVVGAICIPDCSQEFVEEFNNCYGALQMKIEVLEDRMQRRKAATLAMAGPNYRRPFGDAFASRWTKTTEP